MRYFEQFNRIQYGQYTCTNITQRAGIRDRAFNNPYNFYPYQVRDHQRPDTIADQYYNSSDLSWIVYFSNQITDPYDQWYLNWDSFVAKIKAKYGTIEAANQQVLFFRNNWYDDDQVISVSHYNTTLLGSEKKYWDPVYNGGNKVAGYKRKEENWTINTNKIIQCNVASNNDVVMESGSRIRVYNGSIVIGTGTVDFANTTAVHLSKIVANSTFGNAHTIRQISDNTVFTTIQGTEQTLIENVPDEEAQYWSAVTAWDYEEEINEGRRTIYLLDNGLTLATTEQFRTILRDE